MTGHEAAYGDDGERSPGAHSPGPPRPPAPAQPYGELPRPEQIPGRIPPIGRRVEDPDDKPVPGVEIMPGLVVVPAEAPPLVKVHRLPSADSALRPDRPLTC